MPQMKLFGNSRSAARVAGKRKPDSEQAPKEKKQKKKKPLKVLAIWLTVILCLEGLYFFCCYTSNAFVAKWRTIYIQTAMSTMRHQWLATYLLPESVVDDVMRKRTESMEALGDKESSWGAKPEDTTPTAPEESEVKPVDTEVTELPTETMTPEDEQALAKEAVEDAVRYMNAASMPSGSMPVVFHPKAMATLLATFAGVFSADNAQKGLSLLGDKEGSAIASELVTVYDDPSDGLGYAGMPFDGEGVPTRKKAVVDKGVLSTLLYTLKTAKKAGKATTGNASRPSYASTVGTAPTNFYIAPGDKSAEEVYALAGDSVRIDKLMGTHAGANPISGDFSLAAKGMRIRDGKLDGPVEQITVSGNFYALLKGVRAVGNDLRFGMPGACAVGAPTVLVDSLTIAGK